MRIITRKDSETGIRFQSIVGRIDDIKHQAKKLSEKFGFKNYKMSTIPVLGELLLVAEFSAPPNPMFWMKKGEGWYPRQNTEYGRQIIREFRAIEPLQQKDISEVVFPGNRFPNQSAIGYAITHDEYFGFNILDEWYGLTTIPADCEKITVTRYNELFRLSGNQTIRHEANF